MSDVELKIGWRSLVDESWYGDASSQDVGVFFFFSSRRRHTRCGRDWSSDVCSSDLEASQPSEQSVLPGSCWCRWWSQKKEIITQSEESKTSSDVTTEENKIPQNARSEERRVGKECRYRW